MCVGSWFLPVSCPGGFLSGGLSCSPLWVRGSFLRGPLGIASGVLSRPFLLLPIVESLGFGSHASAATGARVRPFVYHLLQHGVHRIRGSSDAAQPFLDDQKGSRQHGGRGDWHTRSGCTRAVRPHGAAIAAGGPGSCTAFPCLRLRPFPTRSRLLSLCAHFPCATMSARVQDVERRNGLSTLGHYDGDATMRL